MVLRKFKEKLKYEQLEPLKYTEYLRDAYLTPSVVGGQLEGKKVLITGGSGGIGTVLALRFMTERSVVTISGRNQEKLESTVDYLRKKIPQAKVDYILIDQSSQQRIDTAVDYLKKTNKIPDILVNNAGVLSDVDKKRAFRNVTQSDFDNVWNINFKGTVQLTERIATEMVEQKISGNIINIASICAEFRNFQYTPYGISKAAIIEYTRLLCKKYPLLTVNVIQPGSVATVMSGLSMGDNISQNCNALYRPALPEEIAAFIAFLAGGFGVYLTDGGHIVSACEIL
ncbi:SDR family NAD(P)-dependent oxidoreductase [[Clostridium] fimetarium]|uniref:NAD(P)-dependent dehydrogenase, short-chain alcohol dehydrogenase family n=1 Tax=[Clostridium] fimetarium TaxID=99656 RepID=A0A1I0RLI8_9FIRM|nr:SDR family oxidoreductase [[Clostridium] fimetarium]SEW42018.1 NAD(P)-dependent dehydrogenase, short-chain alcohol dehydrogenase family [[Clostridium] fimetarium]